MKLWLWIGFAGVVGTWGRWNLVRWLDHEGMLFPLGTFAVNLLGATLAGLVSGLLRERFPEYAAWSPVIFLGFFGAFTTFSTFALDCVRLLNEAHYGLLAVYVFGQNLFGIGGAWLGWQLAVHCLRR